MKLTNICQLDGNEYTMELNCTPKQLAEGYESYNKGALLQNAFPFLNAGEREFVKTGILPSMWDAMFADE